jgi:hypothetical protein
MAALTGMSLEDLAREYGRGRDWMADNWPGLVKAGKLPPPIADRPYVWDAAQVYALRDKPLTPAQRAVAAAFRAALDVAHAATQAPRHHDQAAGDRAALSRRFGG